MTNIILCGGSGTRLWPISRTLMPKQFVKLFDGQSLFQLTVERNSKVCDSQFIVSNAEQYFLAQDQLEELTTHLPLTSHYLLEPIARNTAPAIALACMALNPEEIVLVTPSDHLIKNETQYQKVIEIAKKVASQGNLVTFGIKPTFAQTGFGYIEAEASSVKCEGLRVKKFHEKPDLKTAQKYLEINQNPSTEHLTRSTYLWNSGMFCFKAGMFLDELKKYSPEIYETSKVAFENKKIQHSTLRIQHSHMEVIPDESIDYAVMEKSSIVKVIPSDINWSDVGSFDSLSDECKALSAKCYEEDSQNNFYYCDNDKKVIATIGLEDYIVIDTPDALLIAKKGETQKVKNIVAKIKHSTSRIALHTHLTGNRPWGTYTILEESMGYKIKRIEVKPKKRLSLQKHSYRNEHWVVVNGIATVEVEDKIFLLHENESTYIKAEQIHRLSNNTNAPLVIIEVQVGSYTGEDDIVRISDDYQRF
ncbi:mannose-1-phosphate guanylyltransferase/mannose-6-phosphate isomerase [Aliarcobacter cryaerophilus]|uniref:mannose-1-phosphate guanylyltransferase n=1 Tax=Aliarcobacter cryaerophilus TaxID=28198 RepID=A0A2S9T6M7_9BACT|nr:mannose-1-phosphate guanylyltransferase/mannose-6-phosphate isomerase [Aliarcobacter cryaerophilus]PRM94471.1 mannose-1-phosphate guanylyltransferase/mannose-6-phosphate isomerase [Aliarcobacter cryaerophilus]